MHYRKIWEKCNNSSLLPGIEIHHIDGNHKNDDPKNLRAVTPKEHFDIHLKQGDLGAASLIAERTKLLDPQIVSQLQKKMGRKNGKNSWNKN